MKYIYVVLILFLFLGETAQAQLTGFSPSTGTYGQALSTTITGSGIFIQSSSPSGNLFSIKLIKGVDQLVLFDYPNVWNYWGLVNVLDPNTVTADFTVPLGTVPGVYDLEVITGDIWDPWWNQNTYTLPAVFTVAPPDGYLTGNVYQDSNKNGVKDAGEPGLSGRTVLLSPLMISVNTDVNGDYSFPLLNGTYTVSVQNNTNDIMFNTSSDSITVTIASNNSPGNNFGLKTALYSITPTTAYQGVTQLHQIVSDEPIFHPGGPVSGNISQFRVLSSPSFNVSTANVTVIDSFTIWVNIPVPVTTTIANDIDLRLYTSSGTVGYHYLRDQLDIVAAPSYISGRLFFDQNQNKINDPNEPGLGYERLDLTPDNSIAYTNLSGNYLFGSLGGVQTVTPDNIPGLVLYTDSASFTFNAVGNITGKDFGYQSTNPDYSIQVKNLSLFARCNSQQYVYFKVRNTSNVTYDARVWLKIDPLMSYVTATPPPSSVSNDTVYFNIFNLLPYSERVFWTLCTLPGAGTSVTVSPGASSLDINDVVQLTSGLTHTYGVFCAWDPNDKQVTPEGILAENFVLMTDTLEYLIRFQNTGNDTAFNVVVMDTLDADLDFNTFEVLESSHSMLTELKSNGAVKFTFNNILLVDSNVNEPMSHGYIKYRIRALTGLPDSTEVLNTAHIFFDFNPAVVTNTTLNTLVYVLPTGLSESDDPLDVSLYPNPFSHSTTLQFDNPAADRFTLTITDVTGKVVAPTQSTSGSKLIIEKNKLSCGIYFYLLKNTVNANYYTGKLIIE